MKQRSWFLAGIILLGLCVFGTMIYPAWAAGQKTDMQIVVSGITALEQKVDEIVRNQNNILSQLSEIKAELQIVKVRASQ